MGQPPLQGAVKQSIQGTFSSDLREATGLMGLRWCGSEWLAVERAEIAAESVPAKAR